MTQKGSSLLLCSKFNKCDAHSLLYLKICCHHAELISCLHSWSVSVNKTVVCHCWGRKKKLSPRWTWDQWFKINSQQRTLCSSSSFHSLASFFKKKNKKLMDLCSAGIPSKLSNWGTCIFFSTVCPAGFCVIFYPEKWIWVVVLWFRQITDLCAPNHGRRPAAPQAIERLQTTGLSSKYAQWGAGALLLKGNQSGNDSYNVLVSTGQILFWSPKSIKNSKLVNTEFNL